MEKQSKKGSETSNSFLHTDPSLKTPSQIFEDFAGKVRCMNGEHTMLRQHYVAKKTILGYRSVLGYGLGFVAI